MGAQKTLGAVGWMKWGPGEKEVFLKRNAAEVAGQREAQKEREERSKEAMEERKRMLGAEQARKFRETEVEEESRV